MISNRPQLHLVIGACVFFAFGVGPSACVVNEAGTSLEWNLAMGAAAPTHVSIAGEKGDVDVDLTRALVAVTSLELIPCSNTMSALREWLFPVAHAHGGPTPTRMAAPHVIDLLADASIGWSSALSHPPPTEYCWVRVTIGPADRDAVGMPVDVDLTESALLVTGSYAGIDVPEEAFTISSTRTQSIDVTLEDAAGEPARLVIDELQRDVAIDVWLQEPPLLDGVDPTANVESLGGLHAITNLLASASARACGEAPCVHR